MTGILHKQLTGPYSMAFTDAINFGANDSSSAYSAFNIFFENVGIGSSNSTLDFVGKLIGFPHPTCAVGAFDNDVFEFGPVPIINDNAKGFGSSISSSIGGEFLPENSTYIPDSVYRLLLPFVAKCKYNGVSLITAIEFAASVGTTDFTVSYNADKDIVIQYQFTIGSGWLDSAQLAADYVTTSPRIIFSSL